MRKVFLHNNDDDDDDDDDADDDDDDDDYQIFQFNAFMVIQLLLCFRRTLDNDYVLYFNLLNFLVLPGGFHCKTKALFSAKITF